MAWLSRSGSSGRKLPSGPMGYSYPANSRAALGQRAGSMTISDRSCSQRTPSATLPAPFFTATAFTPSSRRRRINLGSALSQRTTPPSARPRTASASASAVMRTPHTSSSSHSRRERGS